MTLYELDKDIQILLENGFNASCVDMETGEIDEEKAKRYLEELPIERNRKLEAYGVVIKNYTADIIGLKKEIETLNARVKAKQRQIDRLSESVSNSLTAFNEPKFETPKVVFSFRTSTSVDYDIDKLDEKFITEKVERSANKTEIKKAIKSGETVQGACLVTKLNLQVK